MKPLIDRLTDNDKLVIRYLTDGYFVYPMKDVAKRSGLVCSVVRRIVRKLRREGVVEFGPLMNEDGELRGSGYHLNAAGQKLQEQLGGCLTEYPYYDY